MLLGLTQPPAKTQLKNQASLARGGGGAGIPPPINSPSNL